MNNSNLKALRKNAKLTQEELAEKLNVTRQTVAKWESGEVLPDIESCITMSKLYDVTLDDLVRYAKNPNESHAPKGKHIFGVVKIQPDGSIRLPKKALDIFGLESGDKLILLGDEEQGLALVKLGGLKEFADTILNAIKSSDNEQE